MRTAHRVVPIFQKSEGECGIVCLLMILKAFGIAATLLELRRACAPSRLGSTALSLVGAARGLGLPVSAFRLSSSDIECLDLPAIAHWKSGHYVVLTDVSEKTVTFADPATGESSITRDTFAACFSGVALALSSKWRLKRRQRSQERTRLRTTSIRISKN